MKVHVSKVEAKSGASPGLLISIDGVQARKHCLGHVAYTTALVPRYISTILAK